MANEVYHNFRTGETLYFCAFQLDGNVFLSGGASDEVWGTGGRNASHYDETMIEDGSGGHYVGTFDTSIAAGVYRVTVFLQVGGSPADTDLAIAQGEIYWDGDAEVNPFTIAQVESMVLNIYDETIPGEGVETIPTTTVQELESLADWLRSKR